VQQPPPGQPPYGQHPLPTGPQAPAYNNLAAILGGSGAPAPSQQAYNPAPSSGIEQNQGQPNMQDIMAQLAKYKR
jgi:hypothetical protein